MDLRSTYPTWVEVDLKAIDKNVREAQHLTQAQIMAVVKADGYGHGAVEVARAALAAGASWCGVARIEEAVELRQAQIESPIQILGLVPAGRLEEAIRAGISLTVCDVAQIVAAAVAGRTVGIDAQLHLKVDTGMHRLGARPEEASSLAAQIQEALGAQLQGVFTHFARADEHNPAPVDQQLQIFGEVVEAVRSEVNEPLLVHAANSAAMLSRPDTHFDMVRMGIAIYGLHPSAACPLPPSFAPALVWRTQLSQVTALPPGSGVSYGHTYVTRGHERIGTIPVGYADGMRRTAGNKALVGGVEVPVVGRVCMDQCMLQLDGVPDASVGDEVVLIGSQAGSTITAEDVAQRWETINYEVTCGIGARVPRVHI